MSFEIIRTEEFSRHLKKLGKKYPSIPEDYRNLLTSLNKNPQQGISLGQNCYKIRMNIGSKKAGKRGGARVITYLKIELKRITLLDIYDKADKESITEKELEALIKRQGNNV